MADYSPMMKQYFEVKEKYPNTLLFFRLGDFYEMFFNDAKIASRELELTLTGRDCGQEERAPMCGVPFHSAETYIARLVAKGYKVAICRADGRPGACKGHRKAQRYPRHHARHRYGKQHARRGEEQLHRFRVLSG